MYCPNRAKFCSSPLWVAVITTRFVFDSAARNGPLADAHWTIANGRWQGCSHAASSAAVTSGPRKLNFASWPP
jgi:hypothetical protein